MSGRSKKSTHLLLEGEGKTLSDPELANTLNKFVTSVNSGIPPLDLTLLPWYNLTKYMYVKHLLQFSPIRPMGPIIFLAESLKSLLLN